MLVWKKRVRDSESKLSAAVDAQRQTYKRNTELAVLLTGKDTRRSRVTDGRARLVAFTDGVGMDIETIVVRMGDFIDKLLVDLTALIRVGARATYNELVNLAAQNSRVRPLILPLFLVQGPFQPMRPIPDWDIRL